MIGLLCALPTLFFSQMAPELLTPERLFSPAEGRFELSGNFGFSQQTTAPTGQVSAQNYRAASLALRSEVGLTSFLTIDVFVPVVDWQTLSSNNTLLRFGDPTVALRGGHTLGPVDLMGFAELTFPTHDEVTLAQPSGTYYFTSGAIAATGSETVLLGLSLAHTRRYGRLALALSGRGYYRQRFDGDSNGAGFDARSRVTLNELFFAGLFVDGLWGFEGLDQAFISASRLGDGASWLDLGGVLGRNLTGWLEVAVAASGPLWHTASGNLINFELMLAAHAVPSW